MRECHTSAAQPSRRLAPGAPIEFINALAECGCAMEAASYALLR
jgi:hypothetical protein